MKKLILSLIILAGIWTSSSAQQLPLYSQYMMNGFLLNPAIAGSVDYFPVNLTARQQWVGIDDAPSTQALSTHLLLNNQKIGIGGYIFNDKFGPVSRMGIQAAFAYHLPLPGIDSKLGLGLAFKGFQYKLDETALILINDDDPAISKAVESTFVPDADFGVYLYNNNYFVGLAATQLIEFKIKLGDNINNENKMVRHYFLTGGYKFQLSEQFELEPSVLVKGTERTPFQVDFNAKAYYKKSYWLGVSYRSSNDIVAMIGFKVSKFYMGYSFDYTTTNIKNYSSGSHEIMIGFNIKEGAQKGSSLI
jgi:type IX secretion system PorP/SprF family membrane protein